MGKTICLASWVGLLFLVGCTGSSQDLGSPDAPIRIADAPLRPDAAPPDAPLPVSLCTNTQCRPPACCGDSCTAGSCCAGTVCGSSGRCIPASCTACGQLGCHVDFDTCTATCSTPSCCSQTCTGTGQGTCCPGTSCYDTVSGTKLCFPNACDACGGMTPLCSTNASCGVSCVAPPTCGKICEGTPECGLGAVCETFVGGVKKCVPTGFRAECNACGSDGCLFFGGDCHVECKQPDAGVTMPPDAGVTKPPDAGVVTQPDARPPPDGGTVPDAAAEPSCRRCCESCGPGQPACCAGSGCGRFNDGSMRCLPDACSGCDYGCTFTCPP